MAFIPHSYDGGYKPSIVKLPAAAITPKIGMGLAFTSGKLAASAKPEYICAEERSAAVAAGTLIQVIRVNPAIIFESEVDAATEFAPGTKADVTSDGLTVDGDGTTNQNFFIEEIDGTAAGSKVRGRFV